MALSGSLTTTKYGSRYLEFTWSASQSIADNESTITWELYGRGGSGYYKAAPITVTLDGATIVNKTARFELWNGTKVASGSTKLKHNSSTGAKSFKVEIKAAIYSGSVNCTGSKTFTLDTIPRKATVVSAPDFNDTENPTITYQNLIGSGVDKLEACISLTGAKSDIAYREISKTGTSYTFNLTDAERKLLLQNTTGANSRSIRFYVRTTISGTTYLHYLAKTFSVKDPEPTLNPTIIDSGSVSKTLTNNQDTFIKGYNVANVDIGLTLMKEATVKSVKVTNGTKTLNAASGYMYYVETDTFNISVTDSRNNTVTQTVKKGFINYINPTCNLEVGILNAEGKTTLKVSGVCFSGSFGAITNQKLLQYRYKEDEGEYTSWKTTSAANYSGNNYTADIELTGLNYRNAYTFQTRIVDSIHNGNTEPAIESVAVKVKSVPVADWSKEDFNFNVPINYLNQRLMYVAGDSVTLSDAQICFSGFVSNGQRQLYVTIPLSKPIFASGVTLDGAIICRANNGYINGTTWTAATSIDLGSPDTTLIEQVRPYINEIGITLIIDFKNKITNATVNNVPISATPYGDLTITFT